MIDLETFDPTDANAGSAAAERANKLESLLIDIEQAYAAQQILARGFKGMGHNILQEHAGRLSYYMWKAKKMLYG